MAKKQSVAKQVSKDGKATFKGPNVKERKRFAPATKVEKPKKGKGSFDRKETFDESSDVAKFVECILTSNFASANKYLKQVVDKKIADKIASELNTPLF